MFKKLCNKYNVANPLDELNLDKGVQAPAPSTGISPMPSLSQDSRAPMASTFGTSSGKMSAPSPFGGTAAPAASANPFGKPPAALPGASPSPFGTAGSTSTFGKPAASNSPFGQPGTTNASASPFANPNMAPPKSPFAPSVSSAPATQAPPSTQKLFNGRSARDLLTEFYRSKAPNKLADVDKLLTKYQGREEEMFRNLGKKYNIDPTLFGVSAAPAPAAGFGSPQTPSRPSFGHQSALGGGQAAFGQASPFGQQAPSPGFGGTSGHAFGSSSAVGGSNFGSLAHSSTPSPFSSSSAFGTTGATSGFGSPPGGAFGQTTPFGAPRR